VDRRITEDATVNYIEADDPLIEAESAELDELADDVARGVLAEELAELDAYMWVDAP
jgi:hypothetical protein